ncbi:MAG: SAM-dependent methyltransferase [Alkaliphilus sp.]|nr:tRNA1(Val) (adenine(37)-N6)-methyltransferase [Alkaliphilus transvaalensis]PHS31132.1 MAG: SAM-dependent methyltransferase [Alkaliphilus sp.]
MGEYLKENERIDDLQTKGFRIIQNSKGFCFGIDAVLLANFVSLKKNSKVVDLGTGTGIIPILIAAKSTTSKIEALEIQAEAADMARRSVILNNLEERINVLNIDLKMADKHLKVNSFDVVTTNPPYMHANGIVNTEEAKTISRHEVKCKLEDVVKMAAKLLKHNGKFYMIHRPQRIVDIMLYCRKYKLEPKKLQFIQPMREKKPNLLIVECTKAARPEVKMLDPLIIYDEDGNYTRKVVDMYKKRNIENEG